MEITHQITINAPKERVWEVLTDYVNYSNWNPYMKTVQGKPVSGERLKVIMQLREQRTFYAHPRVLCCDIEQGMTWKSHLYFTGLHDVEQRFVVQAIKANKTLVLYSEHYKGLFTKSILKNTKGGLEAGFQLMLKALKKRVAELQMASE